MAAKKSTSAGSNDFSSWIGWGISTLLLLFLSRKSSSSHDTTSQQPSKFTDSNVNTVGNPVPVVLGRGMIKNPIISHYGSFSAVPYTEEYGLHARMKIWPVIVANLITGLISAFMPKQHITTPNGSPPHVHTVQDTKNGVANKLMMVAVQTLLWLIIQWIFNKHLGRVTIQKGFKYYLGWQHIICWTGENIGVKKLWMDVYDSEVEQSTQTGVWDNNSHVAWEIDNINGITATVVDENMFGGVDEGGGFIGDVRFYFGNRQQPKDYWMIRQMSTSPSITDPALIGLTPQYPMYLTCVISEPLQDSEKDKHQKGKDIEGKEIDGAYIGKQATIPEMWFEVVNYPDGLAQVSVTYRQQKFNDKLQELWQDVNGFMSGQAPSVQAYMQSDLAQIDSDINAYISSGTASILTDITNDITTAENNYPPTDRYDFINAIDPLYKLAKRGVWTLGRLGDDLNPAEAIYEILKNIYWGCSYSDDRINIESLVDLGVTCEEEELGVSCVINRVAQANEYITKILSHINGVKFDNPTTGQLTFKLIRNDYDINNLKTFDVSNCESCEFSRLDWSETSSAVSVNFTAAHNKYDTSQLLHTDISNRLITGSYTEQQVDGEYFTTSANAKWLAQNSLLVSGYPLSAINLVTNRDAFDVTIGEPIKVSWEPYGISQMVFRVTDVDYATLTDGKISITAIEDVFGFDRLDFEFSSTPAWTDPDKEPFDIARYMFMEFPYEMSFSLDTYLYAFAAKPSNYTVYWDCYRYVGGNYPRTAQSSTWSTVGRMIYGYDEGYAFDSTGFEFGPVGANGRELLEDKRLAILADPYTYNKDSGLNLIVVDNEIMSYDSIVLLPNGNYQLQGVVRGVYDTIPRSHTAESIVYFMEYKMNVNGSSVIARQGNYKDEQLELKTETQDKAQDFEIADIEHFYTTRRSEQPSVMANLQFGADKGTETDYYYNIPTTQQMSFDILFKFIGRNKFNSFGILEQTDDTTVVDVNADTQNYLKVSCNGVSFEYKWDATELRDDDGDGIPETLHNVTDMRLKWVDFCKELDNRVSDSNTVSLTIGTYDKSKDLYSYDCYEKIVNYVIPRMAGVVQTASDVQAYADTLVQPSLNSIVLPATTVSPQITLTFEDCALIFVGTPSSIPGVGIVGQDGQRWDLSTEAYRIDGYDSGGNAIVHKVDIEEEFIFRTNYTTLIANYPDYYRYRVGQYLGYLPY